MVPSTSPRMLVTKRITVAVSSAAPLPMGRKNCRSSTGRSPRAPTALRMTKATTSSGTSDSSVV